MTISQSLDRCVFCIDNWHNLDIVKSVSLGIAIINPLDPVTKGHVLVIDGFHTTNAAEKPGVAAELMRYAAMWVRDRGIQANIITSIGPDATQSVFHTHVHVVPRRENDGLHLPWTGQVRHRS